MALVFLFGCSTVSHVAIGKSHPPTDFETIKIVENVPANAEKIGLVDGQSGRVGQGAADSIIKKMKKSAAQLGANYLVIDKNEVLHGYGLITHVSGTAYFVP